MALPRETDPVALRDAAIFEAIDELFKSENYEKLVHELGYQFREEYNSSSWLANWNSIKAMNPLYDEFLEILGTSHENGRYQPLLDFVSTIAPPPPSTVPPPSSTPLPPPPPFSVTAQKILSDFLDPLKDDLRALVMREKGANLGLSIWVPKKNNAHKNFLTNLRLPADTDNKPDMLLHDLGKLGEDPEYEKRLEALFKPGSISHQFMANTSGSGKTRLLMEGLCKYWGIYLTAETETIRHGSRDMRLVILDTIRDTEGFKRNLSELRPGDDPSQCLLDNENIAERHFNCLLLVRLHILRIFLAIVDSIPPDPRESDPDGVYRKRWLEFQMRPSILNNGDIFQEITLALIKELPDMRMKLDLRALIDAYLKEMAPRVTPNQTNKSLYVVVDEVQHALEELPDAFRSKGRKPRPVFRPMLHSWVGFKNLVVVTAGTGVNSKILEEAMSSAVQKLHSYNQYYDTGSFGRRAESIQRAYIQRFIPPELINQPKFKALVARIIYWLKGRFRFTTAFISELLADAFENPHETLNVYISQLTSPPEIPPGVQEIFSGFVPTDGTKYVNEHAIVNISNRTTFNFGKLSQRHVDKLTLIIELVEQFWLSCNGELKNVTDGDIEFVQWGFARFIPDTTQANARIGRLDEPMALIALAQWLNAGFGSTLHQKLSLGIGNTHALGANGLENYLAFSFAGLFNGQPGRNGQTGRPARRLDEIFTFAKEAPAWAQQTATMVSYYHDSETALEESEVNWASRPSYSLGIHTFKDAKEDNVLPWLRHEHRVPICFPDKTMGPDLLFVLRLEDGERIWVAVQSKFTSSDLLDKGVLTEAVKTVTPVNFYKNDGQKNKKALELLEALPDRKKAAGKYSLLRVVVSHYGETAIELSHSRRRGQFAGMPHYHDDDHPLASLNKKSWGEITKHFLPTNFISDTAMDGPKTAALKNTEKLKLEQAEQAKRGGRAEQPTQKAPTSTVPVKRRSKTHTAGGDSESGEIQQPPKKRRQTATSLIPSGSGMLASPSASTGSYPQSRLAPSVDVHMGGYDDEEAPPDSAAGTEDEPMTDSGYSDTDWGVFSS